MDITNIILKAKKGDPRSERALYDYCYTHCFKVAQIYSSDKEEATSAFNHSMLYVFEQLDKIPDVEKFIPWVCRIIKNDCIDHLRKRTVYKNKLVVAAELAQQDLVFNKAVSNLAMNDIMNLVNQLKTDYRLCFVMSAIDGHSYREISQQLNINQNTAKWYVAESKKILRSKITLLNSEKIAHGSPK